MPLSDRRGEQQFTTTVVAKNAWYALDLWDEHRQALDETITEPADFIFEVPDQDNAERLEAINAEKPDIQVFELTAEERAVLRERPMQARDRLVETTGDEGREILDAPVAGIGAAEQELSPN